MSYILDALKKSENERRAGATPGLAAGASYVVLPQYRSRHRGAALMVAVGMLGTGLALGHWRPWHEDMTGVEAPLSAPVAGVIAAPAPASTVAESPKSAKSRSGVAAKGQPVITPKTSTVVEKKRSFPPPKNPPVVVAVAKPAAMPSAAAGSATAGAQTAPGMPSPVAAARPPLTLPVAPVPAAARVAVAVPVAVAASAASAAAPALAVPVVPVAGVPPAPAARVVAYRELPAAVQSALPNIVFGGFAGGGEADGRIAFINNRLVREGEEVSPGLRLETVDQDGVILGFQGHHFRTAQ